MNTVKTPTLSFVIPVYNEEDNIVALFDELSKVCKTMPYRYEIVFIDDCSTDNSLPIIKVLAEKHPLVHYLSFARNSGQSAALAEGFRRATGDIVVTMDADLQNDPADLPHMLSYYGEYDMVTGWRHNRQDRLSKKIASRIGNSFRNWLTHEDIRDTGCSLKIMNAALLKRIKMYKGLHRFLPTMMRMEGARIKEVKVNHRQRRHGVSKYTNLRRGVEGFYDVLSVRWLISRHLKTAVKEASY